MDDKNADDESCDNMFKRMFENDSEFKRMFEHDGNGAFTESLHGLSGTLDSIAKFIVLTKQITEDVETMGSKRVQEFKTLVSRALEGLDEMSTEKINESTALHNDYMVKYHGCDHDCDKCKLDKEPEMTLYETAGLLVLAKAITDYRMVKASLN